MKRAVFLFLISACLPGVSPVARATMFLNPDKEGFAIDSVYDDDVFLSGGTIRFDSRVEGDLFCFSYEMVQTDTVEGNFNSFCYSMQSLGPVAGSLRSFARLISCNASVGRNLLAFGQEVTVGPGVRIGRDVHLFCQNAVFQGEAGGNLKAECEQLVFSGSVAGDLVFKGHGLSVGPDAVIGGNMIYESYEKAEISGTAKIDGEVKWTQRERKEKDSDEGISIGKIAVWILSQRGYFLLVTAVFLVIFVVSAIPFPALFSMVALWIMLLISGNVLLLILKRLTMKAEGTLNARPLSSLGLGFAILLLSPITSAVLLLTVIAAPLGAVLLLLLGAACFAGGIYGALYAGRRICWLLGMGKGSAGYLCYSTGMVILVALSFIPILGYLLAAATVMIGLGALALTLFAGDRKASEKPVSRV